MSFALVGPDVPTLIFAHTGKAACEWLSIFSMIQHTAQVPETVSIHAFGVHASDAVRAVYVKARHEYAAPLTTHRDQLIVCH